LKQQLSGSALITAAGITGLILILMIANPNALWILLSLPFVLFLPGLGMTLILFPRKSLGLAERLLLSVGLSVAFTALGGLLLSWMPWGLQPNILWTALLLILALEIIMIFFIRRIWRSDSISFPVEINFNTRQWVLMTLAALMTIMAIRVARTPAPQQGLEGYTLLWIQSADTPGTIHVGVGSEEFNLTKYQIKYEIDGVIHDGPTLQLNPGETWQRVELIPLDQLAGKPLTVLLYRLDNPTEVYRRAVWWPESR